MSCKRKRRKRSAFTLVELMVVIVIIGLLASAVTLGVRSYLITGKQNIAKMEIANICQALDTYYATVDRYPSIEQGLDVLASGKMSEGGGLLDKLPRDPWGNPYEYIQPGIESPYEVVCLGADQREGGDGANEDITSETLKSERE